MRERVERERGREREKKEGKKRAEERWRIAQQHSIQNVQHTKMGAMSTESTQQTDHTAQQEGKSHSSTRTAAQNAHSKRITQHSK